MTATIIIIIIIETFRAPFPCLAALISSALNPHFLALESWGCPELSSTRRTDSDAPIQDNESVMKINTIKLKWVGKIQYGIKMQQEVLQGGIPNKNDYNNYMLTNTKYGGL